MQNVRVRFSKEGRAKYISHLDLNRCMARAVRRAGLPIVYTQGFNPHPYLTFALPLPIFFESRCEAMDFGTQEDLPYEEILTRLNGQMPEGIRMFRAAPPVMKPSSIAYVRYYLDLNFEGRSAESISQLMMRMLSRETLIIEKQTKRSVREIEMKPYFRDGSVEITDGRMKLEALLPASPQETVSPSCLTDALRIHAGLEPDFEHAVRLEIFDSQMAPFE